MEPLNVLVVGAGQMGQAISNVLEGRGHYIRGLVGRAGDRSGRTLERVLHDDPVDIAIEFSLPDAAEQNVTALLRGGIPVVCGTTGWNPGSLDALATEQDVALLHADNFSIGMAVMKMVAELTAKTLAPFADFEPAIVERHHSRKRDSPSGTAKMLADVVQQNSNHSGIQIAAVRQGQAAGEHTLIFEGESESLQITHTANSRDIFATGAVRAAEWLAGTDERGLVCFEQFLERTLSWPTNA